MNKKMLRLGSSLIKVKNPVPITLFLRKNFLRVWDRVKDIYTQLFMHCIEPEQNVTSVALTTFLTTAVSINFSIISKKARVSYL
jgi:hypothetical protein